MSCIENNLRYSIAEREILVLCYGATGQIVDSSQKSLKSQGCPIDRPHITPSFQH